MNWEVDRTEIARDVTWRFKDYDVKKAPYTLYAHCIENLLQAAAMKNIREEDFHRGDVVDFVNGMYGAATNHDGNDPDFWAHKKHPLQLAKDGKAPTIYKHDLEGIIDEYLRLPIWAFIQFPFAWRNLRRHDAKVAELLQAMNSVYSDLDSAGPISARHVWGQAKEATKIGVVWPAPLFALLDDIIARSGRF